MTHRIPVPRQHRGGGDHYVHHQGQTAVNFDIKDKSLAEDITKSKFDDFKETSSQQ